MTPLLVYTCDAYRWALKPFMYLLGVYWSREQPVIMAGTRPHSMPGNVRWLRVESRIKERWSDGLIECLKQMDADLFILMLEDFWLCRSVNLPAVASLAEYMAMHPDVLKIDLTSDRLHSAGAIDAGYWGHCDLVETSWETPYQWSLQAAIWNRRHLLKHLRPEMSPWDFELRADKPTELRVMGTRQWPVRYVNGIGMGLPAGQYRTEHIRDGLGGHTVEHIAPEHVAAMKEAGMLP